MTSAPKHSISHANAPFMVYITAVLYTYTMMRNFWGLDSVCKTMQEGHLQ